MIIRTLTASALAIALILSTSIGLAADKDQTRDQDRDRDQTQLRDQDQIYGSQLMTEQERIEHRNRMRSMKSNEEREAYRLEHHKKMQARAKERGVTLPDEPAARGHMMGPGSGGMMGPGGRR